MAVAAAAVMAMRTNWIDIFNRSQTSLVLEPSKQRHLYYWNQLNEWLAARSGRGRKKRYFGSEEEEIDLFLLPKPIWKSLKTP